MKGSCTNETFCPFESNPGVVVGGCEYESKHTSTVQGVN